MRHDTQQSGFSLIEILIGMTIGLIVVLVILQTMSLFEGQRRTSSGVADMQSNGLLSLNALQQDTRLAGYGMIVNYRGVGDLPCVRVNGHGTTPGVFDMIPLSLASSGLQDVITISRMESAMGGLMTGGVVAHVLSAVPSTAALNAAAGFKLDSASGALKVANMPQTTVTYPLGSGNAISLVYSISAAAADTVLLAGEAGIMPKLDCTLLTVNRVVSGAAYTPVSDVYETISAPAPASPAIAPYSAVSAALSIPAKPVWSVLSFTKPNNAGLDSTRAPVFTPYAAGSAVLHNLGPNPALVRTQFFVNAAAQFVRKVNNNADEIVAENVVSLQAQYGISAAGTQPINCWVNPAVPGSAAIANYCPLGDAADWTPAGLQATPANMNRIKAIRVAIVARNPLMEKPENKAIGCVTTRTAPTSWPNGPVIDLTANPDWKCYRYKIYQTIIPLHNVILGNI